MKILIFGDIYWRIWRSAIKKEIQNLKRKYSPDFIIANIDNITSWRWPIEKHILEMQEIWINLMTGWDHIFDNYKKIENYLKNENSKVLVPANVYNIDSYWLSNKWYKIIEKNWKKLLVIHLLGEVFMKFKVYNPFFKIEEILKELKNEKLDGIIIDFHKEVTSEWYWMWYLIDGKVSLVYWTHTHVQTNDEKILPRWTWIISDVWMNWPLNSIIWAEFESIKNIFLNWINWKVVQSLDKNYTVSWVFIEIWDNLKCKTIEKIRINWIL